MRETGEVPDRMKPFHLLCCLLAACCIFAGFPASAQLEKNAAVPDIEATDIRGDKVRLSELIAREPYLVIVHFFSVASGEESALNLRYLHKTYGRDKIGIIALGLKEDETALKAFAEKLDIQYYVIDSTAMANKEWLAQVDMLPLTLFVTADTDQRIERVLRGGGDAKARLLRELAENLFQQRKDEALSLAELAASENPEDGEARKLKGFILVSEGKLDEAEQEFGAIDSKTGLAAVANERGAYDQALALAAEAPANDGYAETLKAEALLRSGKPEEAKAALDAAMVKEAATWQQSANRNLQGRLAQTQGDAPGSVAHFQEAVLLDPYNIEALSNEGAGHRAAGDLDKAQSTLEKASGIRNDDMTQLMLAQVLREKQEANDLERGKLVAQQIKDLGERYAKLKSDPNAPAPDAWSTRPLIVAFLPNPQHAPVFFKRAGTDVVLQRELEGRMAASGGVGIVERQMLDKLLTELNLGSGELASADTQRRLGQVLSAGLLGFIDFAQAGADNTVMLRLVDTETTAIVYQGSWPVDENNLSATAEKAVSDALAGISDIRELKGLVAEVSAPDAVVINLGKKHGVRARQQFTVLEDGEPIEVGGRVIAHRQRPVAKLEVSTVEDEYAVCKVTDIREGTSLRKSMKIKETKAEKKTE